MKLKRLPEDFQVEERTAFAAEGTGDFALYRLTKRGIGTLEALEAVGERWNVSRSRISFGGLKDRHALTHQHVTIFRGPKRDLRQTSFSLEYLGQATRCFTAQDNLGNRFRVVMRSLSATEERSALEALAEASRDGIPNYFDDQRFGSLGESGEHVAQPWIAGDYERTLWLGFAEPNPMDRPEDREEKRILREHWGDWATAKAKLARSHRRSIVTFLADRPGDFKGALAPVRHDLKSLWLAAFQSHLYNHVLGAFLRERVAPERLVEVDLKAGARPFFTALTDDERRGMEGVLLPLPSSRVRVDEGPVKDLVVRALAELGLTLRQVNVKHPRGSFFTRGWRAPVVALEGLEHEEGDDDLYRGRRRMTLSFALPRGSYATILVKRLTDVPRR
jgi:tRNA pseudouridine13 synthase